MKFAHMADCHIGGWREEKLTDITKKAFSKAIDECIKENVEFVLISGDLFNTALPGIDSIKHVVKELQKLKKKGIRCYLIAGSHDFSPSGKTMLTILEEANLCINVMKGFVENGKLKLNFTIDETGAKITGLLGKRGMLEKGYYEDLERESLEKEEGFKIFLFHTALTELKSKDLSNISSAPISLLPAGFNYYAGGHVHVVEDVTFEGKRIVYPGPLFPNSFSEIEKLKKGGFYIYDNGNLIRKDIEIIPVKNFIIDCTEKSVEEVVEEIMKIEVNESLITLRLKGKLKTGRISDIPHKKINEHFKKAFHFMKSTTQVETNEFEEIKIEKGNVEEIEDRLIKEHAGQNKLMEIEKEIQLTKELMKILREKQHEGEKKYEYDDRIIENIKKVFKD